jgi:dTDP-4-dehydrorhamnose reductase
MMKILVLGFKGQLGRCLNDELLKTGYEVFYTSRDKIDIANFEDTQSKINTIAPDVVINAAAYTAVDKAEDDHEQAELINHLAVASIANICRELDCWFLHVSTDYVFDGTSSLPYKESDQTNPQGVYGQSKLMGEKSVQSSGCKYLIFRTSWVFSEYGENFLKSMLRLGKTHDVLRVVDDQVGCPTNAHEIASVMVGTLARIEAVICTSGIYNICSNSPCSWYDFAVKIFEIAKVIGLPTPNKILPISSSEYPTKASRPAYSVLDCSKIYAHFNVDPVPLEKSLFSVMSKL